MLHLRVCVCEAVSHCIAQAGLGLTCSPGWPSPELLAALLLQPSKCLDGSHTPLESAVNCAFLLIVAWAESILHGPTCSVSAWQDAEFLQV